MIRMRWCAEPVGLSGPAGSPIIARMLPLRTLEETIHHSVWGRVLTPQELDRVVVETIERQVPAGGFA